MIKTDSRSSFSAFRLKKDTVKLLQELKRAYEVSYGKEFSNDEFINQMITSIKTNNSPVWDIYSKMQEAQKEIEEFAAESRKLNLNKIE